MECVDPVPYQIPRPRYLIWKSALLPEEQGVFPTLAPHFPTPPSRRPAPNQRARLYVLLCLPLASRRYQSRPYKLVAGYTAFRMSLCVHTPRANTSLLFFFRAWILSQAIPKSHTNGLLYPIQTAIPALNRRLSSEERAPYVNRVSP